MKIEIISGLIQLLFGFCLSVIGIIAKNINLLAAGCTLMICGKIDLKD